MLRIVISLVLLTSTAHAQRAPDMATLDRGDGISKIGLDIGFSSIDDPPYDAALRFELWGQYITDVGLGFYGMVPLSRSFGGQGGSDPEASNATSLSDIELGGLYVMKGRTLSWVFRAGVVFPTATDGRDEYLTRYYATAPRLTDLVLVSDDWWLRLSISPLIHKRRFFARGDVGIDINLGSYYHYLRANAGVGVDAGPVAVAVELTTTAAIDNGLDPRFLGEEDLFHSLALTLRFMVGRFQPFLAIGFPFDSPLITRRLMNYGRDRVRFFISGGLQFTF